MEQKYTPVKYYTSNQLVSTYQADGISGLENLHLSDSDIIYALRRSCIGTDRPDGRSSIAGVLRVAGWDRERFIQAETDFGLDPESLELVLAEFDQPPITSYSSNQLVSTYKANGVHGLENLHLSDSDIIEALWRSCIGTDQPNGMDSICRVLKNAGWDRERFIQAETDYGVDSQSLDLYLEEFDTLQVTSTKNFIRPY